MSDKILGGANLPVEVVTNAPDNKMAVPVYGFTTLDRPLLGGLRYQVYIVSQAQIDSGEYELMPGPAQPVYEIDSRDLAQGVMPVYVVGGTLGGATPPTPPSPPAWTPASPTTSGGVLPHTWHYADSGAVYQDAGITLVANDGDVVGRSVNQGSDAHNANQTTTGLKPVWKTNILNGKPVFQFDGIDDFLRATFAGALSQPHTVFAVAKLNALAVDDSVFHFILAGSTNSDIRLYKSQTGTPDAWSMSGGVELVDGAADSNWNIWTGLFNGASSQLWLNGTPVVTGDAGSENAVGITIGATHTNGSIWVDYIPEILIYDPNLSTADMNQVGAYIAAKYGLTWNTIT